MFHDWLLPTLRDLARVVATVGLVAIPVAILLSHLHVQYDITRTGYTIAQVTRTHRDLTESSRRLQIEAAVQGRTERMTTLAKERFGLEPTRPEQVTLIEWRASQDEAPAAQAALAVP